MCVCSIFTTQGGKYTDSYFKEQLQEDCGDAAK